MILAYAYIATLNQHNLEVTHIWGSLLFWSIKNGLECLLFEFEYKVLCFSFVAILLVSSRRDVIYCTRK